VNVGFGDWKLEIGWTWLIVIGTAITFGLGYLFSLFGGNAKQEA